MNKIEFKKIIEDGRTRGKKYMVVKIETEGNPGVEIILNPSENFGQKVKYYDQAYNDYMELTTALGAGKLIRITDVLMTSNLSDLSWFVY